MLGGFFPQKYVKKKKKIDAESFIRGGKGNMKETKNR